MICESWPWTVYIYLCSSEYTGIFGGKIYIHLALADLLYPIWYALSVYQRWCICLRTCLESQYKRFILQAYLLWGNGEMKQTKPSRLVEVPLKQSQQNEVLHCFLICHGLITYDCSHRALDWIQEGDWIGERGGGSENEETVEKTFTFHWKSIVVLFVRLKEIYSCPLSHQKIDSCLTLGNWKFL